MSKDQFYQSIMQSAVDPMVVINARGLIVDLNQATVNTFGYDRHELIDRNIAALMPEHVAVHHDQYLRRYLRGGSAQIIGKGREVIARHKDGSLITCYLAINEVDIDNEIFFTGILRNIQAETEARETLAFNYQALSLLNEWVSRERNSLSDKIESFLKVLNRITVANLIFFIPDTEHPHSRIPFFRFADKLTNNDITRLTEVIRKRNRNVPMDYEAGNSPLNDLWSTGDQDNPLSSLDVSLRRIKWLPVFSNQKWLGNMVLCWNRDVTDRHLDPKISILKTCINSFAEFLDLEFTVQDLALANDRFCRGQIAANIGTWDWDIRSGELFWSEQIAPLFGYQKGELKTSYENFMAAVHPDDRDRVQRAVDACIARGERYDIDHRIVWPDGSVHWVNEKGNVTRDDAGNPVKMLGVVQDINRAKRAEEHLLQATLRAEQANRAKTEFLSLMSHELRTPLNSILGFAQLLNQEDLKQHQLLFAGQILDSGNILLKLVNDILDFSRLEATQIQIQTEDVDLHKLARQCIQMLGEQARKAEVQLEHVCDGDHPLVRGDLIRLKQILINLISNAIKYNRAGGLVQVNCELLDSTMLRMTVKDTGHGIAPERRPEVFQPFSRLGFKNSSIEGAGIGLLITKKLIESMGGAIDFVSEPGKGSTFWVDIPTTKADSPPNGTPAESTSPVPALTDQAMKVLYVEDNPSNTTLMHAVLLQQKNYQLLQAVTAGEGLAIARKENPDVIIMDINLPDFDGIEACRRLKAQPETRHIPVIALTADVARQSDKLLDNRDFCRIMYKPFDLQELLQAIQESTRADATVN